jgi:ribose 5-phosphate isomerase A
MPTASLNADGLKRQAARGALEFVGPGMRLGLGTGSTAAHFVECLAERVRGGLEVTCVPTSEATRRQAEALAIPLTSLEETPELDLAIDGTDEFDRHLRLVKGGGGALLHEKIVAGAARRMIVIADGSKEVEVLGRFGLPVEVVPFGLEATRRHIGQAAAACGCAGPVQLRRTLTGSAFLTDGGHYIVDCAFGRIPDPEGLAARLNSIAGVVEHGLFLGLAKAVIIADYAGLRIIGDPC